MNSNSFDDRKNLTFEQAEGVAPLASQLLLKEVSQQLRSLLWMIVHEELKKDTDSSMGSDDYFGKTWKGILYDKHVHRDQLMADEFVNHATKLTNDLKKIFVKGDYIAIFGFLQYVLRHRDCPYKFAEQINWALQKCGAAYAVIDRKTIVPISSEIDRGVLEKAFADLAAKEFHGARAHLRDAGAHLTDGHISDSIRESIHAVESVARVIAPSDSLRESLFQIEKAWRIHIGLKKGFLAIYGYTCEEKGLRHPLLDDPQAKVDEADAMFMIGACSAFVSYLINRARTSGLLATKN